MLEDPCLTVVVIQQELSEPGESICHLQIVGDRVDRWSLSWDESAT